MSLVYAYTCEVENRKDAGCLWYMRVCYLGVCSLGLWCLCLLLVSCYE